MSTFNWTEKELEALEVMASTLAQAATANVLGTTEKYLDYLEMRKEYFASNEGDYPHFKNRTLQSELAAGKLLLEMIGEKVVSDTWVAKVAHILDRVFK